MQIPTTKKSKNIQKKLIKEISQEKCKINYTIAIKINTILQKTRFLETIADIKGEWIETQITTHINEFFFLPFKIYKFYI